jgi:hypothetical protein
MIYNKGDKAIYENQTVLILDADIEPRKEYAATYKIELVTKVFTQRFWVHNSKLKSV